MVGVELIIWLEKFPPKTALKRSKSPSVNIFFQTIQNRYHFFIYCLKFAVDTRFVGSVSNKAVIAILL